VTVYRSCERYYRVRMTVTPTNWVSPARPVLPGLVPLEVLAYRKCILDPLRYLSGTRCGTTVIWNIDTVLDLYLNRYYRESLKGVTQAVLSV
jgi:hypothetical protein